MTVSVDSWTLERFVLGELPREELRAIEEAIAGDASLERRVDELRESNREILSTYDRVAVGAAIRGRTTISSASRRGRPMTLAAAAAVLVVAVLAVFPSLRSRRDGTDSIEETRIKGAVSSLHVFRKTRTGSELLASGSAVAEGDIIRLGYKTAGRRYGVIVSIDGRNHITRHWPAAGAMASSLQADGVVLLDQAFELDDAPRFERFYLVTSVRPFAVEGLVTDLDLAYRAGPGTAPILPPVYEVSSIELRKEASR
jgi:hypothetical protein